MCIFAHLFHLQELSLESKQNLILQILNSSLISLNLKNFKVGRKMRSNSRKCVQVPFLQKFDGFIDIFSSLLNAFSNCSPQLPYFLNSRVTVDPQADMVRLMTVRFPFAVLDCFSGQPTQSLASKVIFSENFRIRSDVFLFFLFSFSIGAFEL